MRLWLTPNWAGEVPLYLTYAPFGTNSYLGSRCWRSLKFLWAVGAMRKPLAEARWRSVMA